MSKQLVVDGDTLLFEPLFGNRQVTILGPAIIRGERAREDSRQKNRHGG